MPGAFRIAASLLVPPRCAICAAPCAVSAEACAGCSRRLASMRGGAGALEGVEPLVWAGPYEGIARALVAALKFHGRLAMARLAAQALADSVGALSGHRVVPVPPAPLRHRRRGFDAAELIAAALAAELGLPLDRCLVRRHGRRQVGRPRALRLADPPRIRVITTAPARALLVDDVLTTGATVRAAAAALRSAGSERVGAAVFARALRALGGPGGEA